MSLSPVVAAVPGPCTRMGTGSGCRAAPCCLGVVVGDCPVPGASLWARGAGGLLGRLSMSPTGQRWSVRANVEVAHELLLCMTDPLPTTPTLPQESNAWPWRCCAHGKFPFSGFEGKALAQLCSPWHFPAIRYWGHIFNRDKPRRGDALGAPGTTGLSGGQGGT